MRVLLSKKGMLTRKRNIALSERIWCNIMVKLYCRRYNEGNTISRKQKNKMKKTSRGSNIEEKHEYVFASVLFRSYNSEKM